MQTAIPTACRSGSDSDDVRSAAEADRGYLEPVENDVLSFDGKPEEILEEVAAEPALLFVAKRVTWRPHALRF